MTLAIIVPVADKFVSVINGAVFNTSKHIDYLEHHAKLGDVKRLNTLGVTLFVHTDIAGAVTECIEAENLSKGRSYKTAERYMAQLDEVELTLIAEAFKVATAALEPKPAVTPEALKQLEALTAPAAAAGVVGVMSLDPNAGKAPEAESADEAEDKVLVTAGGEEAAPAKRSRKAK